jgi:NAD(P)-dependent dehydrogenase (short-subunit alcohol dehydrogenase family)
VNVGSVTALAPRLPCGWFDEHAGPTLYAAVRAALNRFTQGLAAELLQDGIAVNSIAPSPAIRTPGAVRYIPDDYPGEDVAYLAEWALQLCLRPAAERTGLVAHSLQIPPHAHPSIAMDGRSA